MAQSNQLQTEQEHHRRAFELYRSLGAKRSYRKVASEFGVSISAVKLFAKSFDWRGRLQEREAETARRVADQTLQTQVHERGRRRKIVHMALQELAQGLADRSVRMPLGRRERRLRLPDYPDGHPVAPERWHGWVWLIVGVGVVVFGGLLAYFLWWGARIT